MNKQELINQIKSKRSFLCIGLDTDIEKIPAHLLDMEDPVFEFNKEIINATRDLCVAYKPNIAFYESMGPKGWDSLRKTLDLIPENIFTIADAKRGDIGNTSNMYAKSFFENMDFHAVTVVPYMGSDSVKPFLKYKNKWAIILSLTSNVGGLDFQNIEDNHGKKLFEQVLDTSRKWGTDENIMYVVGATRSEQLSSIRKRIPDHFLLIPGIGAQGGDLSEVVKYGMNSDCGLLINSSRDIIYSSSSTAFAESARLKSKELQCQMDSLLSDYGL